MSASKVLYTGDNVVTSFNIPFPYISATHLKVFVDTILQLNPMNYTLSGASTILFGSAPGDNAAIEIRRHTSPDQILVDFVDGSVLSESDLDTSYLHNFYLSQEYADSFNEIINNVLLNIAGDEGILETETDLIIAALVNSMLEDANAANLQARIIDIDANAEAILTLGEGLQVQINTLASGVAAAVYIQPEEPVPGVGGIPDPITDGARWYDSDDNNRPYIYVLTNLEWVDINDPRIGNNAAQITLLYVETGDNAAAIVSEQVVRSNADSALASDLSLLGVANGGDTAWIINLDTVQITDGVESLADRFSSMSAVSSGNAADIITEASTAATATGVVATNLSLLTTQMGTDIAAAVLTETNARISADGVLAGVSTVLRTDVDGNTALVSIHGTSIDGLEAEYGVDLNVNGYISGFRLNNGGTPGASSFVILADRFAIVDPSGDPGEPEYVVFQIVNGNVRFNANVEIDGDLIVSGTINGGALINGTIGSTQIGANAIFSTHIGADQIVANHILAGEISATHIAVTNLAAIDADLGSITAGNITLNTTGYIKGGQTAYNTGSGFWLGYDSSAWKFSLGNTASGNYLTWDGTELVIKGDLVVGEYIQSANIMLSATTERLMVGSDAGGDVWVAKKGFTVAKDGEIRVTVDYKTSAFSDGTVRESKWRVKKNSTVKSTWTSTTQTTYTTRTINITGVSAGDSISIELSGGASNTQEPVSETAYVQNAYIKADVILTAGGSVTQD